MFTTDAEKVIRWFVESSLRGLTAVERDDVIAVLSQAVADGHGAFEIVPAGRARAPRRVHGPASR
jgi:hypothetical protein